MIDKILVTLGEDHTFECSADILGREGEGNITRLEIVLPEKLLVCSPYLDFELGSGETLRTPKLQIENGVAYYDVEPYILAVEGEIKVQVVLIKDGKTWKSSIKKYFNQHSINADDEIPDKEDFFTDLEKRLAESINKNFGVVQETGDSETEVMSQKAATDVFKRISTDMTNVLPAIGEYVIDDSVEIQNGYYDGITFYPHASYRSARIDVESCASYSVDAFMLGERNGALASFYDADNNKISDTGACSTDTTYTDFEVSIPLGCKFFIVEAYEHLTVKKMAVTDIKASIAETRNKTDGLAKEVQAVKDITEQVLASASSYYGVDPLEVQNGFYDCQPNGATFVSHASYKSARIDCVGGEKYRVSTYIYKATNFPVAWLYNSSNALIGTVGGLTGVGDDDGEQITNFEFDIPANCAYFITTTFLSWNYVFTVEKMEVKEVATVEYVNRNLNTRETGFRELAPELQIGMYDCQPNGATFVPHDSYRSVKVDCTEGEKYRVSTYIYTASGFPVAWLYSSAGTLISSVGGLTGAGDDFGEQITDFEFDIPANCAFFITTQFFTPDSFFKIKRYVPGARPLSGKNAIYLGDSITYIKNGWRTEFNAVTGANEVMCKAVSGAHLCDYEDTVVDGLNYFEGNKNTLSNQVQDIINSPPTERIDFIIIAAGTNDHASLAEFEGGVTQFVTDGNYTDIENLDRTRYDGAMRWVAEKLWAMFPDAVIFFATPIQGAEAIRETRVQLLKSDYIQKIASYLGTPVMDATRKSGIYGRYENANAPGKYLDDGLHPNLDGRTKLGRYYASEVINYFSYLKD